MASPHVALLCTLLALLFKSISCAIVTTSYQLDVDYSGSTFFDNFDFFSQADYTHGFVTYVPQQTAIDHGLITAQANKPVFIGVDDLTILSTSGPGRESVRISSKKAWTHGLFILDLSHMPGQVCGAWPAFWMVGPDWPNSGEIDIIEGVNSAQTNLISLHSNANCSISGQNEKGQMLTDNCDVGFSTTGCGVSDSSPNNYGTGFNSIGGGVYATEWTSEYIKVWFFPRTAIPNDITSGTPDPSSWGLPTANLAGGCDIDNHFANQQIIFDTTFCGDWAAAVWDSDATCGVKASSCVDYVAQHPEGFTEAYWAINYLRVFKSVSVTATSAPTSTISSSSSSAIVASSSVRPSSTSSTLARLSSSTSSTLSSILKTPTSGKVSSKCVKFIIGTSADSSSPAVTSTSSVLLTSTKRTSTSTTKLSSSTILSSSTKSTQSSTKSASSSTKSTTSSKATSSSTKSASSTTAKTSVMSTTSTQKSSTTSKSSARSTSSSSSRKSSSSTSTVTIKAKSAPKVLLEAPFIPLNQISTSTTTSQSPATTENCASVPTLGQRALASTTTRTPTASKHQRSHQRSVAVGQAVMNVWPYIFHASALNPTSYSTTELDSNSSGGLSVTVTSVSVSVPTQTSMQTISTSVQAPTQVVLASTLASVQTPTQTSRQTSSQTALQTLTQSKQSSSSSATSVIQAAPSEIQVASGTSRRTWNPELVLTFSILVALIVM